MIVDLGQIFSRCGIRIHGGKNKGPRSKNTSSLCKGRIWKKNILIITFCPILKTTIIKDFYCEQLLGLGTDGGLDNSIIKDEIAHSIASEVGVNTQDFNPAIVFINGEYWGIYGIRDYIDENYISYTYNIDKDSIEMIDEGTSNLYLQIEDIFSFINQNNLNNIDAYEHVKSKIDINNYIDYQITEMFLQNYDWPENNEIWRPVNGKLKFIF